MSTNVFIHFPQGFPKAPRAEIDVDPAQWTKQQADLAIAALGIAAGDLVWWLVTRRLEE